MKYNRQNIFSHKLWILFY